jgi:hypothetical protein
MATNTYVALDKVTVSGTTTNAITFSSIPSTYTDLVLVANAQQNSTTTITAGYVQINGDSGNNYSSTVMIGNGTSATSSRRTSANALYWNIDIPTTSFTTFIYNFMNYANSSVYKTIISRFSNAEISTGVQAGLWSSTPAINSITINAGDISQGGNTDYFTAGSTFSLYGIKADTNATPKATGGVVSSDATYWYHTFGMSGTFTPNQSLSCDYLVVAGGGGGGSPSFYFGGGGAGGFRTGTSLSVTAQAYTITVGAGGAVNTKGSNSVFSSITSTGGGFGGNSVVAGASTSLYSGGTGGSGGGAGNRSDATYSPNNNAATGGVGNQGSYSPSEGNNGGTGYTGNGDASGSGGGGAGGAGAQGVQNSAGGAGGAGTSNSYSGSAVTYAGGGGGGAENNTRAGGAGGAGGGGKGSGNDGTSTAGTANRGGGGGGGASSGTGGSGIVIIRYAK